MRLSYQTITWGGVVGHPVGVTSIKDLFYLANGSTEAALRDVAAAGYEGIEIFDGNLRQYEDRPDELKRMLADSGLELVAVYSGANFIYKEILEEEFWRIEKAATLAAEFGAQHLVVGGGAQRYDGIRDDDYVRLAEGLDRVVEIAGQHGLQASYHPHLSTIVEGPEQIEKVFSRSRIGFCPDVAHLTAGGGDPAALIRRYAHRVVYAHLKDFSADPFAFLPLGKGSVDFRAVLDALKATGLDGWVTVELDAYDGAPIEAAKESKAYLASLGVD
jgi:inosose dehydratase